LASNACVDCSCFQSAAEREAFAANLAITRALAVISNTECAIRYCDTGLSGFTGLDQFWNSAIGAAVNTVGLETAVAREHICANFCRTRAFAGGTTASSTDRVGLSLASGSGQTKLGNFRLGASAARANVNRVGIDTHLAPADLDQGPTADWRIVRASAVTGSDTAAVITGVDDALSVWTLLIGHRHSALTIADVDR